MTASPPHGMRPSTAAPPPRPALACRGLRTQLQTFRLEHYTYRPQSPASLILTTDAVPAPHAGSNRQLRTAPRPCRSPGRGALRAGQAIRPLRRPVGGHRRHRPQPDGDHYFPMQPGPSPPTSHVPGAPTLARGSSPRRARYWHYARCMRPLVSSSTSWATCPAHDDQRVRAEGRGSTTTCSRQNDVRRYLAIRESSTHLFFSWADTTPTTHQGCSSGGNRRDSPCPRPHHNVLRSPSVSEVATTRSARHVVENLRRGVLGGPRMGAAVYASAAGISTLSSALCPGGQRGPSLGSRTTSSFPRSSDQTWRMSTLQAEVRRRHLSAHHGCRFSVSESAACGVGSPTVSRCGHLVSSRRADYRRLPPTAEPFEAEGSNTRHSIGP